MMDEFQEIAETIATVGETVGIVLTDSKRTMHNMHWCFCILAVSYTTEKQEWIEKKSEPRCEKTGLQEFRPGPTETGLYSHRRWLEH